MILPLVVLAANLAFSSVGTTTSDQVYINYSRSQEARKGSIEMIVPVRTNLPTSTLILGLEATDSYAPQGEIKRYGGNVMFGLGGRKNFRNLTVDLDALARVSLRQRPEDGLLPQHSLNVRLRLSYPLTNRWSINTFAEQPLYSSTDSTYPSIGIGVCASLNQ